MVPQYLLCDICGEKIGQDSSLNIEYGGDFDCDNDWRASSVSIDLCQKHLKELVHLSLIQKNGDRDHKRGQILIDIYNKMKAGEL